jgi:hypothetical protein
LLDIANLNQKAPPKRPGISMLLTLAEEIFFEANILAVPANPLPNIKEFIRACSEYTATS